MKKLILVVGVLMLLSSIAYASHSSCPCQEPFTGINYEEIYQKALACSNCKKAEAQEHAESSASYSDAPSSSYSEESYGLGDYEHSRSEEIRRLEKLRKKQLKQILAQREIKTAKGTLKNKLTKLRSLSLTETDYRAMQRSIDTLIYKDKYADRVQLQKLKRDITKAYGMQAELKKKIALRSKQIKEEKIKKEKEKQKQEKKKQREEKQQKEVDKMLSEIAFGGLPSSLVNDYMDYKAKAELTKQDLKDIREKKVTLMKGIKALKASRASEKDIMEAVMLLTDYMELTTPPPAKEELWDFNSALDQRRANIERFKKSPRYLDEKTEEKLMDGEEELSQVRAMESAWAIFNRRFAQERQQYGEVTSETAKQAAKVFFEMNKRETKLINDYKKIANEYPLDYEAHFALSELLAYKGELEQAKFYRDNAFSVAPDVHKKVMDQKMVEKFKEQLKLHREPTPENSGYMAKMSMEFKQLYFSEETAEYYKRTKKKTAVEKAFEWAFSKPEQVKAPFDLPGEARALQQERAY